MLYSGYQVINATHASRVHGKVVRYALIDSFSLGFKLIGEMKLNVL